MIAGKVSPVASNDTKIGDEITDLEVTRGQGVLAIPNIYDGGVQNLPTYWKALLVEKQQNPITIDP